MIRSILYFSVCLCFITGCDRSRVYEANRNMDDFFWLTSRPEIFTFSISDTSLSYNVFCHLRNNQDYPYSRLFFRYTLQDSTHTVLQSDLLSYYLFNPKTGDPLGKSGLGDLFSHQIPILKEHSFSTAGTYSLQIEQYMRTDSLAGILSVGLRVEKIVSKPK